MRVRPRAVDDKKRKMGYKDTSQLHCGYQLERKWGEEEARTRERAVLIIGSRNRYMLSMKAGLE